MILTPQARSIAMFTVSVALLLGQLNRITLGIVLFLGEGLPKGRDGQFVITVLQLAVAGTVLAFALVVARAGVAGWPGDLAQAAVIVAGLGLAIAAVVGFGGVVHGSGSFPTGAFTTVF